MLKSILLRVEIYYFIVAMDSDVNKQRPLKSKWQLVRGLIVARNEEIKIKFLIPWRASKMNGERLGSGRRCWRIRKKP